MPVPTDTLRDTKRLNVVFGLTAILTLVVTGWMLWHDFSRPWRGIQTNFFNARSAIAHFTVLGYESPEMKAQAAALNKAVDQARGDLDKPETKDRLANLKKELETYQGELQGANLTYGNRNAELGVVLFSYEEAKALHGVDSPKTKEVNDAFQTKMKEVADAKVIKDKLEDLVRNRKDQIKQLTASLNASEKALAAFNKGRDDAVKRDSMYGPGFMRTTLNLPILDYAPPKETAGHQEVRQVFTKDVRVNFNFTDSYATDRCITCHVGINDPNFSEDNFVKQGEHALMADAARSVIHDENEKLVKALGKRLAEVSLPEQEIEVPADASATPQDLERRRNFIKPLVSAASDYLEEVERPRLKVDEIIRHLSEQKKLSRGIVSDQIEGEARKIFAAAPPTAPNGKPITLPDMNEHQRKEYVQSLTAALNVYLRKEGRPAIEFNEVLKAHPHLDLFVSPNSPHTLNAMACRVCHEGSGDDTDFVYAAHTPRNEEEKEEWKKKYYNRELGIPMATFHLVEEFWERPMLLAEYTSASCVKCHTQIYDLERHKTERLDVAENVVEGRDLFTKVGCINCHNVDGLTDSRRVGPDLAHVGTKLSTGFMERWVEYPNNFRPSTRMPHFFKQENNLNSSKNEEFDPTPELRTSVEIKSIVHYLKTFTKPFQPYPLPEGLEGDPKHGEELFVSVGCLACHVNLDAKDPLDQSGRSFAEKWIVDDLIHDKTVAKVNDAERQGQQVTPDLITKLMEQVKPTAQEEFTKMSKNDRARYASDKFTKDAREAAQKAKHEEEQHGREPNALVSYIPPVFTKQGPELSGLGTKLINDAGDTAAQVKAKSWLYTWLREPRHYSSYTVMPRLLAERYYSHLPVEQREKQRDQDILDIGAYLLSLRNDEFKSNEIQTTSEGDKQMEALILDLLGGQNTESVAQQMMRDEKVDPSEDAGPLTRAIISQTFKSFGGGEEGKKRVAHIIESQSGPLRERQELFLGMKMIAHYGCYACHNIAGFEDATRPGTDLSLWGQKFITQLDFGFYAPIFEEERAKQPKVFADLFMEDPEYQHLIRDSGGNQPQEILHNHASFAYHKLRNPRIWDRSKYKKPYEKLKMPNFFFTDAESKALTTFLVSRKDPLVTEKVKINYKDTPVGRIARGRALVRDLNCIGCHTIEGGSEAIIHQYYTEDTSVSDDDPFSVRFKPPLLWGEGAKIQYNWLFTFLNNVEKLRPWLRVRMPSFYLSDHDATTLVEYFAGLSQYESKMLKDELVPIAKYLQTVHGGDAATTNPATATGTPWFMEESLAPNAEFLKRYALANKQATPFEFDISSANSAADVGTALQPVYDKVVKRAAFLSNVFDVKYPFLDARSHKIAEERFKHGEEFFYDEKCLACHVAGDPSVPGTTQVIKAPNFALSGHRLRYDWVINWIQDPQAIQPGANMPQIFQGGSAYSMMPEDVRKQKEAHFGTTVDEQASLLVDFIFSIAERNYTAIQPGAAEAQKNEAQKKPDDAQFDFDGGGDKKEEKKKEEEVKFDF